MSRSYAVFNQAGHTLLASEVQRAEGMWPRIKGLIGRRAEDFRPGRGLWITPSEGIHTIGMKFPIDVIYLDAKRRVVRVYHGLKPWRVAAISFAARSVLELPAGTVAASKTKVGDVLEFEPIDS